MYNVFALTIASLDQTRYQPKYQTFKLIHSERIGRYYGGRKVVIVADCPVRSINQNLGSKS